MEKQDEALQSLNLTNNANELKQVEDVFESIE